MSRDEPAAGDPAPVRGRAAVGRVPVCIVDDPWSEAVVTALNREMRTISNEYAANMRWAT